MKKLVSLLVLFVSVVMMTGCSNKMAKVDIQYQDYQISLSEAMTQYQQATNQQELTQISFEPSELADKKNDWYNYYGYYFFNQDNKFVVDANTGETLAGTKEVTNQSTEVFGLEDLTNVKEPKEAMKEAMKGSRSSRVMGWTLKKSKGKFIYTVAIKTLTSAKEVEVAG